MSTLSLDIVKLPCACTGVGYCERYQKDMTKRYFQFCQGTSGLSREKEEVYLGRLLDKTYGLSPSGCCPEEKKNEVQYPSVAKQAANFMKSAASWIVGGANKVSDTEYNRRFDICKTCEFYDYNLGNPRCTSCGCYLLIKNKWTTESCPVGKWGSMSLTIVQEPPREETQKSCCN